MTDHVSSSDATHDGSLHSFCTACGAKAEPGSSFCHNCGQSLTKTVASPIVAPIPPPTIPPLSYMAPPHPPTTAFQATRTDTTPAGSVLAILSGAVMAIGAFLPWFTAHIGFATLNRNAFQLGNNYGFSIDGVLLLAFGAIAIAIGISRFTRSQMPRWIQRSPIVLGLAAGLVLVNRVPSINDLAHNVEGASSLLSAGIGYGVWVTGVGAALAVAAGFALRSQTKQGQQ